MRSGPPGSTTTRGEGRIPLGRRRGGGRGARRSQAGKGPEAARAPAPSATEVPEQAQGQVPRVALGSRDLFYICTYIILYIYTDIKT